ncbi:MAG: carbohydrate ABC transporter substrate-binding protein, partial [Cyanobacteria bacterium J06627_28]
PNKVDGTPMQPRKGIKQFIVLNKGQHQAAARDFATYLIQPNNLNQLLKEGFKGRVLPVMPQLLSDAYWSDSQDPHLSAAFTMQEQSSPTPYEILHPAYSEILGQQVWGQSILQVLKEKQSPEQAVDWAISQIQTMWTEWEAVA